MSSWFSSLQFRLTLGFVLVLALALASVSFYVGFAAEREVERFQQDAEAARAARVEYLLAEYYSEQGGWVGLQHSLEQAATVFGRRIVVRDSEGRLVADSHQGFGKPRQQARPEIQDLPILMSGREIGSMAFQSSEVPDVTSDPSWSRLVSAMNRSLIWTGLAAGA